MHMCSSIINLNNPYTLIEEEILGNLDERDDAIDNVPKSHECYSYKWYKLSMPHLISVKVLTPQKC